MKEKYYFACDCCEVEINFDHPVRVKSGELTYCYYIAENFYAGTEIECYLNGKWIAGVLDTESVKAYNKLCRLELLRSVQAMNKPKLFIVRG
jgi:hypothetical protein